MATVIARAVARRSTMLLWLAACAAACALAAYGGWIAAERRPRAAAEDVGPRLALDPALFGHRRTAEVRFSLEPTPPAATPPLLSGETRGVYAFFDLPPDINLADVDAAWWWNGEERGAVNLGVLTRNEETGASIRAALVEPSGNTLGPGVGEFEATYAGVRIARGSFVTAEQARGILAQPDPPTQQTTVRNLVTAGGVDDQGRPQGPTTSFDGSEKIWAVFEYQGADAGAAFVVRWYCEGKELPPARTEVTVQGEAGIAHAWIGAAPGQALPPADYEVTVSYGAADTVLAQAEFRVRGGPGARPPAAHQP